VGFNNVVQLVQMEWSKHPENVDNPVANAEIYIFGNIFRIFKEMYFW